MAPKAAHWAGHRLLRAFPHLKKPLFLLGRIFVHWNRRIDRAIFPFHRLITQKKGKKERVKERRRDLIWVEKRISLVVLSPSFHMDSPEDSSVGLRTPDSGPLQGAKNIAQSKEYCVRKGIIWIQRSGERGMIICFPIGRAVRRMLWISKYSPKESLSCRSSVVKGK